MANPVDPIPSQQTDAASAVRQSTARLAQSIINQSNAVSKTATKATVAVMNDRLGAPAVAAIAAYYAAITAATTTLEATLGVLIQPTNPQTGQAVPLPPIVPFPTV